jgi:hypothetical protein
MCTLVPDAISDPKKNDEIRSRWGEKPNLTPVLSMKKDHPTICKEKEEDLREFGCSNARDTMRTVVAWMWIAGQLHGIITGKGLYSVKPPF